MCLNTICSAIRELIFSFPVTDKSVIYSHIVINREVSGTLRTVFFILVNSSILTPITGKLLLLFVKKRLHKIPHTPNCRQWGKCMLENLVIIEESLLQNNFTTRRHK